MKRASTQKTQPTGMVMELEADPAVASLGQGPQGGRNGVPALWAEWGKRQRIWAEVVNSPFCQFAVLSIAVSLNGYTLDKHRVLDRIRPVDALL